MVLAGGRIMWSILKGDDGVPFWREGDAFPIKHLILADRGNIVISWKVLMLSLLKGAISSL